MPQQRLERYFASSKSPRPATRCGLLQLPPSVRELIYQYVGLDHTLVDLNYSNLTVYAKGAYPETIDCRKLDTHGDYVLQKLDVPDPSEVWEIEEGEDLDYYGASPWGRAYGVHQSMLLVCRQIHQEVEAFIYAGAVFRVCLGHPLGFTRLLSMSDHALSNVRSLTIRLDVPKASANRNGWAPPCPPSESLDLSTEPGKLVLKSWLSVLHRSVHSLRPRQLRLRVIFCAKTMADAKAIIEPMLQLPQLKDCGICVELSGKSCWWRLEHVSL